MMRYWTWDELRAFLIEHDLVLALGDDDEEAMITPKGAELAEFLAVCQILSPRVEQ